MAKPRTFISSTCYDFADARASIAQHLKELGHEPLRSDSNSFGVSLGKHSHNACLDQVENSDYLVLLIGGRQGGTFVGSEKSITNEEYRHALKKHVPVIAFVKRDVSDARPLYKKNPNADFSHIVDDNRIFDFIDLVSSQSENNWIKTFDTAEQVKQALTDQFAYIALEYSKQLIKQHEPSTNANEKREIIPFPTQLPKLADSDDSAAAAHAIAAMKKLHKIIKSIATSPASGKDEKLKLLWIMGRYGDVGLNGISLNSDKFKQYAWGPSKGKRVFTQIADFGVTGDYDEGGNGDYDAKIWIQGDENTETSYALKHFVETLMKATEDDSIALDRFKRADMTVFT